MTRTNVSREFRSELDRALALLKPVQTILKSGRAGARFFDLAPQILVEVRRLVQRTASNMSELGWAVRAEAQVVQLLTETSALLEDAARTAGAGKSRCIGKVDAAATKLVAGMALLEQMALVTEAGWLGVSTRALTAAGVDLGLWHENWATWFRSATC